MPLPPPPPPLFDVVCIGLGAGVLSRRPRSNRCVAPARDIDGAKSIRFGFYFIFEEMYRRVGFCGVNDHARDLYGLDDVRFPKGPLPARFTRSQDVTRFGVSRVASYLATLSFTHD